MSRKEIFVSWGAGEVSEELEAFCEELGGDFGLGREAQAGARNVEVSFVAGEKAGVAEVRWKGEGSAEIAGGGLSDFGRGLAAVLSGLAKPGVDWREKCRFRTLGAMLDCSRNAVMQVERVKGWLRRLALLGYNQFMLYTEDTWEVEGEEYFGYLRGKYTRDELKEMDGCAARLGIELVPCIQTLAHCEQILKWPAYGDLRDTANVMLVDAEETYRLIEKMLDEVAATFQTRRVHIGMDEAGNLGLGKFLQKHGYEPAFKIISRHLTRVAEMCEARGLKPMMWSDMFFRSSSPNQGYYEPDVVFPAEVVEAMPENVELVYWDYYHWEADVYEKMLARHRELSPGPSIMAGGVYTWVRLWYDAILTEENTRACVEGSLKAGVEEIFFTMWGDDGAYCEFDSAFAGLAFSAGLCCDRDEPERLEALMQLLWGVSYEDVREGWVVNHPAYEPGVSPQPFWTKDCQGPPLLWDDPVLNMYYKNQKLRPGESWDQVQKNLEKAVARYEPLSGREGPVDFGHLYNLARFMAEKVDLARKLDAAWAEGNVEKLKNILDGIPALRESLGDLKASFRRQWMGRNKPHGFEVIQMRLAVLDERYLELGRRLEAFLKTGERIPELDEHPREPVLMRPSWARVTSSCVMKTNLP